MKRSGRSSDSSGPSQEAYGYRRSGGMYVAQPGYYLDHDEKRDCLIVRRRSDDAILMVVKGDRVILKVV